MRFMLSLWFTYPHHNPWECIPETSALSVVHISTPPPLGLHTWDLCTLCGSHIHTPTPGTAYLGFLLSLWFTYPQPHTWGCILEVCAFSVVHKSTCTPLGCILETSVLSVVHIFTHPPLGVHTWECCSLCGSHILTPTPMGVHTWDFCSLCGSHIHTPTPGSAYLGFLLSLWFTYSHPPTPGVHT